MCILCNTKTAKIVRSMSVQKAGDRSPKAGDRSARLRNEHRNIRRYVAIMSVLKDIDLVNYSEYGIIIDKQISIDRFAAYNLKTKTNLFVRC